MVQNLAVPDSPVFVNVAASSWVNVELEMPKWVWRAARLREKVVIEPLDGLRGPAGDFLQSLVVETIHGTWNLEPHFTPCPAAATDRRHPG